MPDDFTPQGSDVGPNESSFGNAAAGSLLGPNALQQAIDSSTKAMNDLTEQVKNLGGQSFLNNMPRGASQSMNGGQGQQSINGGVPWIFGSVGGINGGASAPQPMMNQMGGGSGGGTGYSPVGPSQSAPGGPINNYQTPQIPGMGSGFGIGGIGGGGGGSPPAWMTGSPGFSNGGSSNMLGAAAAGGGAPGVVGAFANMANNQMSNQVALNSYETMGSYAGYGQQQIGSSLLGSGGKGYNNMAQSLQDAVGQGSVLSQYSGTPIAGGGPGSTPTSRAMWGGASMTSLTNPGMSATQAGQTAGQFYSPQTSMQMRISGMPTPLQTGGQGAVPQAQEFNAISQRMNIAGLSNKQYAQSLAVGQTGYLDVLQGMAGGNPQQAQSLISSMEATHTLSNAGWAPGKIQNAMQAATGPGGTQASRKAALDQMKAAGMPASDISRLQSANAPNNARTADQTQGFNKGLQAAAGTVQKFNTALANMMKKSGLDKYVGMSSGAIGATNSLEPGFMKTAGSALSHIPGIGGFLGGAVNALGGGAAAPGGYSASRGSAKEGINQSTVASVTKQAKNAVKSAESQVGVPYKYGGEQPGKGFDCGGLTQWAYGLTGIHLPRTATQQWRELSSKQVPLQKVQEGDLVFAAGSDGTPDEPGHVGMMVGSNKLVQAPFSGGDVQIVNFDAAMWHHAARPTGTPSRNKPAATTETDDSVNKGGAGALGVTGRKPIHETDAHGNPIDHSGTKKKKKPITLGQLTHAKKKAAKKKGSKGASSNSGNGGGPVVPLAQASMAGVGASGTQGMGDVLTGGSTQEGAAFMAGVTGGIAGGSGYTGQNQGEYLGLPATGGGGGGGSSKSGPVGAGLTGILKGILSDIGAPSTSANMSSMTDWSSVKEGFKFPGGPNAGGKFNPLNTTLHEGGSTSYNSAGVQNYKSAAQGAQANAQTLKGGYPGIVAALKSGKGLRGTGNFGSELLKWSGGGYSSVAAGGPVSQGQIAWVGERGPELVRFNSDAHVMTANETAKIAKNAMVGAQQAPHVAGVGAQYNYGKAHPVFSGGQSQNSGVSLQFDDGSIVIQMPSTASDTGANARSMASAFVNELAKNDLYSAIAKGKKV